MPFSRFLRNIAIVVIMAGCTVWSALAMFGTDGSLASVSVAIASLLTVTLVWRLLATGKPVSEDDRNHRMGK